MVQHVTVPRRYVMVWTGAPLPFLGAIAMERVLQVDTEATLEVHLIGDVPTGEHLDLVTARSAGRLEIHRLRTGHELDGLDPLTARRCRRVLDGIAPGASSARSNLLRYAILHRRGGVYLDTDVLLLHPIGDLAHGRAFVGIERVWRHDRARVEGRWTWRLLPGTVGFAAAYALRRADTSVLRGRARTGDLLRAADPLWTTLQPNNAVIGAPAGSELTGRLLERAADVDPRHRYALGPSLLQDLVAQEPDTAHVVPEPVFYPVPPSESHRFFDDRRLVLPATTLLVHYVASNHRSIVRSLRADDPRLANRQEIVWSICRDVLARTADGRRGAA